MSSWSQRLDVLNVVTGKPRSCPRMPASGFTIAKPAAPCSNPKKATAAYSALTAPLPVRRSSRATVPAVSLSPGFFYMKTINSAIGAILLLCTGASIHQELALLVEAGMSPSEALAAETSKPAGPFGGNDTLLCIAVRSWLHSKEVFTSRSHK